MSSFDTGRITRETYVRHVEYHETLDSTNKLATELLESLTPLCPALVLTANQTAGQGRGTNQWWAMSGALTFTLVLDVDDLRLSAEQLPLIPLVTGLAVQRTVAGLVADRKVYIKGPNDVLIGEQKLCGILTKHYRTGDRSTLIIGVGVNTNNSLTAAPDDVKRRAVSLFDVTSQSYDLTDILVSLLKQFEQTTNDLRDRTRMFLAELNARNILQGRHITIEGAESLHSGDCLGIDEDGAILLTNSQGVDRVYAGTVLNWSVDE